MIGRMTAPSIGSATLNDDGVWESDNPALARSLNHRHDPHEAGGVACILPFGHQSLADAAADFGGEVEYANPPQPLPPDMVS